MCHHGVAALTHRDFVFVLGKPPFGFDGIGKRGISIAAQINERPQGHVQTLKVELRAQRTRSSAEAPVPERCCGFVRPE